MTVWRSDWASGNCWPRKADGVTLTTVATYDLARFVFPARWLASLWLYEHVVKIMTDLDRTQAVYAVGTLEEC